MDARRFFDNLIGKGTAPPQHTTTRGIGFSVDASDHSASSPYYKQFRIPVGGKTPEDPFVTISQLKTHLGLLRAVKELKNRVTDLEANQDVRNKLPPLAQELEPEKRWTWFLELALERYVLCSLQVGLFFAEI